MAGFDFDPHWLVLIRPLTVLQSERETKPPKVAKVNSFSDLVRQLTDGLFGVRCESDSAMDYTWPERIQAIALSALIGV